MPDVLPMFNMKKDWRADIKMNGTCTVLSYEPQTGQLEPWTRHHTPHILWQPNLDSPCLRSLRKLSGGLFVLVGELLHSKVKGIRDTLYLFDVLVADGKDLVGQTLAERRSILHGLWPETPGLHYNVVDERLWTANLLDCNFRDLFNSLKNPENEGIVLKNQNAPLEPCYREGANASWQVKCRRPTKVYGS